jgi:hypothetical protein
VLATEIGTPLNRHNLTQRSFRPLLAKAGLPQIRFHDLRHTCATILLSKGVYAKFVQELLGHSTTAITLDTYSPVWAAGPPQLWPKSCADSYCCQSPRNSRQRLNNARVLPADQRKIRVAGPGVEPEIP